MAIDAHVHFWRLAENFPIGLNRRIALLERDFLPSDLKPICHAVGVDRVILVQAAPDTGETLALLEHARSAPFVGAVVGWVDVADPSCGEVLDRLMDAPKFVGVRLMAAEEVDVDWLKSPAVLRGATAIAERDLVADLLVRPSQLAAARDLLERTPHLRANINHCGRPLIVAREWQPWSDLMAAIAEFPNVTCKYSGLIERGGLEWSIEQIQPYVSYVLSLFGPDRLMFASNWPVIEILGTYRRWWDAATAAIDELAVGEAAKRAIFGESAERFYLRGRNADTVNSVTD